MSTIKINTKNRLHAVSPMLYGVFFEDINYAGDGGLYAELVANRAFSYYDRNQNTDKSKMCWEAAGNAKFEICSENPINNVHKKYAHISGGKGSGLKNLGFCKEGFAVGVGEKFVFFCYAKAGKPCRIGVQISDGKTVYAKENILINRSDWCRYDVEIASSGENKHAFLEIVSEDNGEFDIGFVSLFPKNTYKNRTNGLRKDIAEMIEALAPKFMRFPGGCIVEGRSFENMYNWKDTIGDITERRTNRNRWQMEEYQPVGHDASDYFQSYGIGFYEYFCFCEDIGAKPLPILNCGMTCQWHEGLLAELDELDKFIQDVLDLIEFANGSPESEWGSKRAKMGHREPFNLEYIGIGNEQWGRQYFDRYERFEKVISEKYPDIKLVTSAGWTAEGEEFDTAMEWLRNNKDKAYAADEHFYKSPEWFLDNIHRYDDYDRSLPKVFMGEYAAHTARDILDRRNNWYAALTEAAFLTGVEKNSDHVAMSCYAPLLARENHQQWQPDLIWFDNDSVYGTPSYYVQKLFSNFVGDEYAETVNNTELYISSTVRNRDNMLIVKIVNVSGNDIDAEFVIDGEVLKCTKYTLQADPDAQNSRENPKNVYPVCEEFERFEKNLCVGKYSVAVMELKM